MVSGSIDLFNRLPDPLLSHIISFLSTKEAASTSVLSKRWHYLLAFVPNLEFDDSIYLHPERRVKNPLRVLPGYRIFIGNKWMKLSTSFPDFVDRILALQGKYPVHKFFLKIVDAHDPDCVTPWINNVLARGVSDIHLIVDHKDWSVFTLPSRIFLSETLVSLRINTRDGPAFDDLENVHLPKLKILHLESVCLNENIGFSKLLSGCHVLEELILDSLWLCIWDSFSVSVATLKRLTFSCWYWRIDDEKPSSVLFDTPNLVYLDYHELVAVQYPKVKLDSLLEAKIDLLKEKEQVEDNEVNNMAGNATNFIMRFSNVHTLYLSANTLEVLTFCCEAIPIFSNLTQLTIQSKPEVGWESLPGLLKNCPNLQTLVFQGLYHKATDRCGDVCLCNREEKEEDVISCLSSSFVKVLKIFINDDKIEKHTEQVKYFLETMQHLEQLVLYYDPSFDENVKVSTQLQMLTRVASPKCKVQLIPSKC